MSDLFPDAEVVYSYEKGLGYTRVKGEAGENLELGKGYWILLNKIQSYTLSGEPICEHPYTVYEDGWYLIGETSYPSHISIEIGNIIVIYRYVQGVGYQRVVSVSSDYDGDGLIDFAIYQPRDKSGDKDTLGTFQEKIVNYQVDSGWEHVFAGNFDGY